MSSFSTYLGRYAAFRIVRRSTNRRPQRKATHTPDTILLAVFVFAITEPVSGFLLWCSLGTILAPVFGFFCVGFAVMSAALLRSALRGRRY